MSNISHVDSCSVVTFISGFIAGVVINILIFGFLCVRQYRLEVAR